MSAPVNPNADDRAMAAIRRQINRDLARSEERNRDEVPQPKEKEADGR